MSIRSSISLVKNPSGSVHLYSECGGDICIHVYVDDDSITYYEDMYLTVENLRTLKHDIEEHLDWLDGLDEKAHALHTILSHKYDDEPMEGDYHEKPK